MKSNIRYVNNKDNIQKKELLELIKKHINKYKTDNVTIGASFFYELLLYSKYIIEREKLDYSKIINGQVEELIPFLKEKYSEIIIGRGLVSCFVKYKIYEIIRKIAFEDYEISIYKDRVLDAYIENNKKYLLISNYDIPYINHPNVDICDINSTKYKLFKNQLLDEILGIKREYFNISNEINIKKYDSIIYINDGKKYIDAKEYVVKKHKIVSDIFMICKYSDISNYSDTFETIETIMIDKDKTYIKFCKKNPYKNKDLNDLKISIKELSKVNDNNLIKSNEEINNISVLVSLENIKNNNHRIGFTNYTKGIDIDQNKVLRLIDYNKSITKKIRELDDEISNKIDRMIVR